MCEGRSGYAAHTYIGIALLLSQKYSAGSIPITENHLMAIQLENLTACPLSGSINGYTINIRLHFKHKTILNLPNAGRRLPPRIVSTSDHVSVNPTAIRPKRAHYVTHASLVRKNDICRRPCANDLGTKGGIAVRMMRASC